MTKVTDTPDHDYRKFNKKDFLEEKERLHVAQAFFKKAHRIGTFTSSFVHEGKTILFVDTLQNQTTTNTVKDFIQTLQVRRIGMIAQEQYFEELEMYQNRSPHGSDNDVDDEMLHRWLKSMVDPTEHLP